MKDKIDKGLLDYHLQLNSLFENNYIIMLLINPENGSIVDANYAACKFYGYSKSEITNMKITDINLLSKQDVFNQMKHANSYKHNAFVFQHRLSDGEVRDVEVYSGPVNVNDANLLYSIIIDITEKVEAQRKIRESEERYRRLVELSPDGVIVYQDLNIVFANKKMYQLMECSDPNDLIGTNILDILHPAFMETSRKRIEDIGHGVDAPLIVSKIISTKGKEIDIEVTSNSLIYEGKESVQSLVRDISERIKIEEKLHNYTQQLELGLEVARDIQEKHLPAKNQIEGVDIEVLYKPLMELGGDFCSIINDIDNFIDYKLEESSENQNCKLESENYGLLMGDVVGKGPSAAMITNEILSFLNHYNLKKHKINPKEFMEKLNEHLCTIGTKEIMLSTASYYNINILSGSMTYSNAGHEKAILYTKKNDSITWLKTDGTLLGIDVPPPVLFQEKSVSIENGDKLILYSDGATELRDEMGNYFGPRRLGKLVDDYGSKSASELKAIIEEELSKYAGGREFSDDCIVVILDFLELGKKSYKVPGDIEYVDILLKLIGQSMTNINMSKKNIDDIKLAFKEAFENAVIHGVNRDIRKMISISLELTDEAIKITVKDQGKGFDYNLWNTPREYTLKELGRGLMIINSTMDAVSFSDEGSSITMIKKR